MARSTEQVFRVLVVRVVGVWEQRWGNKSLCILQLCMGAYVGSNAVTVSSFHIPKVNTACNSTKVMLMKALVFTLAKPLSPCQVPATVNCNLNRWALSLSFLF